MKKTKFFFLLLVGMLALLLSGCGDEVSQIGCQKIAFSHFNFQKETNPDIYVVCPDGSDLTQLTDDPSPDTYPAWSPDGERIAFASSRTGENQIFVMDADGTNQVQVTFDFGNDKPIWLPDGHRIAFRTTDSPGLWWWRVLDMENNEITRITEASYDFFYQTPAWSPDGLEIAYMSLEEQSSRNDGSSQIHVKNVDGSNDRALTSDIWANIFPVWSPDGERIAFLSERDGTYNVFALYVMEKDGTHVQRISQPIYTERAAFTWSADGREIVIGDVSFGRISMVNVNTGKTRALQLLEYETGDVIFDPAWQP